MTTQLTTDRTYPLSHLVRCCLLLFLLHSCREEPPYSVSFKQGDHIFFVFSDTGAGGSARQRAVARVADSLSVLLQPEFIIHTGDCFHGDGLSSADDTTTISANFTSVYSGSLAQKDWYPLLGNHEYCGNPQAIIDYRRVNPRWKMSDRFYSKSILLSGKDSLLMLFLDTSPYLSKYRKRPHYSATYGIDQTLQTRWIDSSLSCSNAKWKIVFGHHPAYTADFGHGNTSELIEDVVPLFKQNGVQAYFSGHIHSFQHTSRNKINLFTTSTGGLEPRFAHPWFGSKYWATESGFTICVINESELAVYFVNYRGQILYKGTVFTENK